MTVSVEVLGVVEFERRVKSMTPQLLKAYKDEMERQTIRLAQYVQTQKLSGQVLQMRSRRLLRSIHPQTKTIGDTVEGRVGTNVEYAAIHELGGTIPSHDIVPRYKKSLSFMWNGRRVCFRKVTIPAITMKKRSFLKSSYDDLKESIKAGFVEAGRRGVK